jgi:hypothetical protein
VYLINGKCIYSGGIDQAQSAATYAASVVTLPSHSFVGVTDVTLTGAIAHYTDGTNTKQLPITLHYASSDQCAFAGDWAAIPSAAVDVSLAIIFTVIGGLILCRAIYSR